MSSMTWNLLWCVLNPLFCSSPYIQFWDHCIIDNDVQLKLLNKERRSPKLLGNKYLQIQAHYHACKDQTFEQQVVGMFQTTSPIVKVGRICPQWLFQPPASQCMHNFLLFHDRPKSAGNVLLPHMLGKLVRVLTWYSWQQWHIQLQTTGNNEIWTFIYLCTNLELHGPLRASSHDSESISWIKQYWLEKVNGKVL
jgi:hypothetical protein